MTWFKPITSEFNGKTIFEKYEKGRVLFSSKKSSRQGVVCEWGDNVEDSGEESNDIEDNSFEAIVPMKAKSKGEFLERKNGGINTAVKKLTYH